MLGSSRRNPILSLNTRNNDLFPPPNNPVGFFSVTFKKNAYLQTEIDNRTFQNKKFGTNLIKINLERATVSNIITLIHLNKNIKIVM